MEEGSNIDYKLTLDINSEREKLEMIKDIVAIANSGGGKIVYGENHESQPGVDNSVVSVLDSARCADQIKKYTGVKNFELKHETKSVTGSRFIVTLVIPPSQQLIVMSREGSWKGFNNKDDKLLFNEGDIWVRHSSKTERISNDDIRNWIDAIRLDEREKILSRISTLVKLPEGSAIEVVSSTGKIIESPKDLLANACLRRRRDPAHLLAGGDLLWVFRDRGRMTFTQEELGLVIASSLRRNPTLYWWLTLLDEPSQLLIDELFKAINGTDRDKSDASRSVIELASIYADEQTLRELLKALRSSDYAHFKTAAEAWESRSQMRSSIAARMMKAKIGKTLLRNLQLSELESLATETASSAFSKTGASSKSLGGISRVIWFKKKGHLLE